MDFDVFATNPALVFGITQATLVLSLLASLGTVYVSKRAKRRLLRAAFHRTAGAFWVLGVLSGLALFAGYAAVLRDALLASEVGSWPLPSPFRHGAILVLRAHFVWLGALSTLGVLAFASTSRDNTRRRTFFVWSLGITFGLVASAACWFTWDTITSAGSISGCHYASFVYMQFRMFDETSTTLFIAKVLVSGSALLLLVVAIRSERSPSLAATILLFGAGLLAFVGSRPFANDANAPLPFLAGVLVEDPAFPTPDDPCVPNALGDVVRDGVSADLVVSPTGVTWMGIEARSRGELLHIANQHRRNLELIRRTEPPPNFVVLADSRLPAREIAVWLHTLGDAGYDQPFVGSWRPNTQQTHSLGLIERGRIRAFRIASPVDVEPNGQLNWGECAEAAGRAFATP